MNLMNQHLLLTLDVISLPSCNTILTGLEVSCEWCVFLFLHWYFSTELLDLEPLPVTALGDEKFQSVYNFSHFNPIQTQIFHCLYHNISNALIGELAKLNCFCKVQVATKSLCNCSIESLDNQLFAERIEITFPTKRRFWNVHWPKPLQPLLRWCFPSGTDVRHFIACTSKDAKRRSQQRNCSITISSFV